MNNYKGFVVMLVGLLWPAYANACLPEEYQHLSAKCEAVELHHQLMSFIFNEDAKPRQIAVVAGVSEYPNLAERLQLPFAAHDVATMRHLFAQDLQFDEVIVLTNEDFSNHNLHYLFQTYLPSQLSSHSRSRVVFTFSGHGADFEGLGYLFFHDTDTISLKSFDDTTKALNLSILKSYLDVTISTSQHFLALINSCNGGHFLNQAYSFGEASPLEEKGAHGITAGGADDTVYARPGVGSGKGSVFFEMVNAAFSDESTTLGNATFPTPVGDDGILTVHELHNFLTQTIQYIENYDILPRQGRLRPPAPGSQGEMFFVLNREAAMTAMKRRFPERARRLFGDDGSFRLLPENAISFLEDGFAYPPAGIAEENPDLITADRILQGDFIVVNDKPWRRKEIVASREYNFFQPRAAIVEGKLIILFFAKTDTFDDDYILLREFIPEDNILRTVDKMVYASGTGYYFDTANNLIVDGEYVKYFGNQNDYGRRYRIASNLPAEDHPFDRSAITFLTENISRSPSDRYTAISDLGTWVEDVYEDVPEVVLKQREAIRKLDIGGWGATGIFVYDHEADTAEILFLQEYTGDWSIGRMAWSSDSSTLYFDNSGAVACIWKYDLYERRLQKIVPEHDALSPVVFRYNGAEYVLFSMDQRIYIAKE